MFQNTNTQNIYPNSPQPTPPPPTVTKLLLEILTRCSYYKLSQIRLLYNIITKKNIKNALKKCKNELKTQKMH